MAYTGTWQPSCSFHIRATRTPSLPAPTITSGLPPWSALGLRCGRCAGGRGGGFLILIVTLPAVEQAWAARTQRSEKRDISHAVRGELSKFNKDI
eukprot:3478701-Prymnesium_polylepis.1